MSFSHCVVAGLIVIAPASLVQAQVNCPDPPAGQFRAGTEEKIKMQLKGNAELLTKWVGDAGLSGRVRVARAEAFQSFPDANKALVDEWLLYMICKVVFDPSSTLTPQEKLDAFAAYHQDQAVTNDAPNERVEFAAPGRRGAGAERAEALPGSPVPSCVKKKSKDRLTFRAGTIVRVTVSPIRGARILGDVAVNGRLVSSRDVIANNGRVDFDVTSYGEKFSGFRATSPEGGDLDLDFNLKADRTRLNEECQIPENPDQQLTIEPEDFDNASCTYSGSFGPPGCKFASVRVTCSC